MRVLITGGAGFIGSHLVNAYEASGHDVYVLDNSSTGTSSNLAGSRANFIEGDIRDISLVENLVKEADLVLHMAASLGVERIMDSTLESISVNVLGSEVVLKSAAKFNKRILIASTSEIYGKNPKQPLSEQDDRVVGSPQNIRWSYSDAKAIEEAIARTLFLQEGLPVTTVRFFNTVGPRQTGKYGMVIPRFVQRALQNENLVVFGDGNQSRVFCHVYDAIAAVQALLNNPQSVGEVFNVGGIGEITINQLASEVIKTLNSKSEIEHKTYEQAFPTGYEDMQRRVPNLEKIKNLTGWEPKRNLESIIQDVAIYFKGVN